MNARRALAACLAGTTLALAMFAAGHVHGVSDPHTHHTLLDFLIFAQAHVGFLIAISLWVLFALAVAGRTCVDHGPVLGRRSTHASCSRSPPVFQA